MARLPKGIFGPVSGKIGPIVGATWNGIPYVRRAPKRKKNKKGPKSAAQLANEAKFKFANQSLAPFHPYLNIGFQNQPVGKTPLGAAFSMNYHQAVIGIYPDLGIDYAKVVLSTGALPGLDQPVMALAAPDTLELNWQQNTSPKASFDDQLMLVVYCPELALADGFTGGIKRTALHCSFKLEPDMTGKILEVYVSITSLDRKKIAHSIYLGRIEP